METLHVGIWFLIPKVLLQESDEEKRNKVLLDFIRNELKKFPSITISRVGKIKTHITSLLIKNKKGAFERDMTGVPGPNQEIIEFVAFIKRFHIKAMTKHPLVVFIDQSVDADRFG